MKELSITEFSKEFNRLKPKSLFYSNTEQSVDTNPPACQIVMNLKIRHLITSLHPNVIAFKLCEDNGSDALLAFTNVDRVEFEQSNNEYIIVNIVSSGNKRSLTFFF